MFVTCVKCELFIKFAWYKGYKIYVSGYHKKLYSCWKIPNVKNDDFKIEALEFMIWSLNRIIGEDKKRQ
ncbi:hypothetical protein RhiirA1_422184 [Rhizophagus irregularis]|uniref:Uncharacterized protein n=1 Tax=Rhizophagus irregularis TaxID=588596 RepID=A0A2N0RKU1_9GLOM|nr:hypothetical protein RhiirA1_422184 [Rhizophagus irregularis]GET62900.1 hypothetical protein GLOIN_2v1498657 [Rhizophagus irregularis DAOM 181602=DAOM 197198]